MNIRLILQERRNAIVIPAAALQTGSQRNIWFVVAREIRRQPAG